MVCNATEWSSGDELTLTTSEVCVYDASYRGVWLFITVLGAFTTLHALMRIGTWKRLRRLLKRGLPYAWVPGFLMFSVIGSVFSLVKVVRLTRLSDPSAPTEIVLFSMALALFCVTSWSFTFTLLVPYMAALPNFSRLEHRLKFVFLVCGVVTAVFPGSIPMFQLLDVNVKDRITASRALFWASSFNASLIMFVVGVAGHKVGFLYLSFSRLALSFRSLSNPHVAQLLALLGQSQKLASPRSTSSSSRPSGTEI